MQESETQPLELKSIEVVQNDVRKNVPALHRNWAKQDRPFSRYINHPVPENGEFLLGAKETWLEVTGFVQMDLKWLLKLPHHIFWSYMVFSQEIRPFLISFLQEAPPFYLRDKFPDDKDMQDALLRTERLAFLVFMRLATTKESSHNYIANLGELLYDNYLFSVPILLDICLIYGMTYRELVRKLLNNVMAADPRFLDDFEDTVPHLIQVLDVVKRKFYIMDPTNELAKLSDRRELDIAEMKDLVLHFYDSFANIQVFLDVYPKGCRPFCKSDFITEAASFYANVIPRVYGLVKKNDSEFLRTWNVRELINRCRVDILNIVKHLFSYIINEAIEKSDKKQEYVELYLQMMTDVLSESLFISDYQGLHSIDQDIDLLTQIYPELDMVKANYILEGVTSCIQLPPLKKPNETNLTQFHVSDSEQEEGACAFSQNVTGVELESLITEVKDILPHLGEGFIETCLQHFNFKTESVIAAILENALPPSLAEVDWNIDRNCKDPGGSKPYEPEEFQPPPQPFPSTSEITQNGFMLGHRGKNKEKYRNLKEMLDDKTDIKELKDRYAMLSLVEDDAYDDEYDDTYESFDVPVREVDDTDKRRRPFVVPRVLRANESEESESEEEVVEPKQEEPKRDCFVQNPAEIRERYEQKRREKISRDLVGKQKGKGQDAEVLKNREFKNANKFFTANHNRRKQASRKRNQGMIPS